MEEFVDQWQVPSLLIQGANDLMTTGEVAPPVASLVLEGCRHSLHITQPEAWPEAATSTGSAG